ncbi:nucleoside-diphosphate-sugar epimerase family protein [Trichoderma sp. SZMC 28014]
MAQPKKAILVTGATGRQGGATIEALLANAAPEKHIILGLTRNPDSNAAKKLSDRGIKMIKGDLEDADRVFQTAKQVLGSIQSVWGVFAVQTAFGLGASDTSEKRQGMALINAAEKHGVEFFVYTSTDRGVNSYNNSTTIPHYQTKYAIEHRLVEGDGSENRKMQWTILRPAGFMENFETGFVGKIAAGAWRIATQDREFAMIATKDIGWFAAQALLNPNEWTGRGVSLASESYTFDEANAIFQAKVGYPMPEASGLLVRAILAMVPNLGKMFRWIGTEKCEADIPALRAQHPTMLTWPEWIEAHYGGKHE